MAVLVNTKQERENFANGSVKFVSRAYDMRCRKLPFITLSPGIIHLCKGTGGLLNGAAYNRNGKSASKQAKAVLI